MAQMADYYPHQEFGETTTDSYLFDMGRLMDKFGLRLVREALLALRLRPGQKFFPHPTEVAEELEVMAQKDRQERLKKNPYVPCAREPHFSGGWVARYIDGARVMAECECLLNWRAEFRAEPVRDGKKEASNG